MFSITALGLFTTRVSLHFTGALINVNDIDDRYLSTYYYFSGCTVNGNIQINAHDYKEVTCGDLHKVAS